MIRFLLLFGLLLSSICPLFAQSLTNQADRQFDQMAYAKAIDLYEQALNGRTNLSDEQRRAALVKLGYSYQQIRDTQNAERVYRDLLSQGSLSVEYAQCQLYYAQALAANGKYREAQDAYEKYNATTPEDQRGTRFSKMYRDISALTNNAGSYKVEFLTLNTRKAEFSPMHYGEGLVYVSSGGDNAGAKRVFNWSSSPFLDLYFLPEAKSLRGKAASLGGSKPSRQAVRKRLVRPLGRDEYTASTSNDSRTVGVFGGSNITENGGYEEEAIDQSKRFGRTLNTKYHEGPATFTKDGSRVIFTRNNYNNGHYGKSQEGVNKLKLYTATQANGYWGNVTELPFNSDEYSTGHPALAPDRNGVPDQLLYLASDRPGGFGGTDIYVSKWTNGKWSEPVNLGKEVNSKGNELFPFADEKGNIYFSSDGHPGLGQLDMFYAQLTEDGQQGVGIRNLGEPLNSSKDDFGIVTDADRKSGYFSSNRKNGGSDDDLYRFTRDGSLYPCRQLTVSVFDAESKQPLVDTRLMVEDNNGSIKQRELKTDAEGLVRLCVDVDNEFTFVAGREGYMDNKIGFSTKDFADDQPSRLEIPLAKPVEEPKATAATRTLRGRVITQTDRNPIEGAKVVALNKCDGTSQQTTSGSDGTYEFTVKNGCAYALEAVKDNMGTAGSHITKDGLGSTELVMFKKGDVIKIENIYYDLNKATIRPDAAAELDKVVALMKKYPNMKIEMRSHTDSRASAQYNQALSTNRAKAATAYLKSRGIATKRLAAKGYGEVKLLNKCKDGINCPEEDHQQNRRTEIKILTLE